VAPPPAGVEAALLRLGTADREVLRLAA